MYHLIQYCVTLILHYNMSETKHWGSMNWGSTPSARKHEKEERNPEEIEETKSSSHLLCFLFVLGDQKLLLLTSYFKLI